MLRIRILSILLLMLNIAIAQNGLTEVLPDNEAAVRFGVNQTDGKGNRDGYWCEEKNGQRYYSFYKGGKLNGIFRQYERAGKQWRMLAVGVYKDDVPVGPWLYFDENGIKKIKNGNETITDIAINQTDSLGNKIGYWCEGSDNYLTYSFHQGKNHLYCCYHKYNGARNLFDIEYVPALGYGQYQYFGENGMIDCVNDSISPNIRFLKDAQRKGFYYPEETMQCYSIEYANDGCKKSEGWYIYHDNFIVNPTEVGEWIYYSPDGEKTIKHY